MLACADTVDNKDNTESDTSESAVTDIAAEYSSYPTSSKDFYSATILAGIESLVHTVDLCSADNL